jgi:hypothetical protein
MVADTGRWLPGRKVLVSPVSLLPPDWQTSRLKVDLTREQIENAPSLDKDAPVSRQYEQQWLDAYHYPHYWDYSLAWGYGIKPLDLLHANTPPPRPNPETKAQDSDHILRSTEELRNYRVQARDDEVGHVEDFIFDDETWAIRYLVIDTRNWLPGGKVLLAPGWFDSISWVQQEITTTLRSDAVKSSPKFDPAEPINRNYEKKLYDYYGRSAYWK